MHSKKYKFRWETIAMIVLFATIARVIAPMLFGYPRNFAPLDAIALFSGVYCLRRSTAIFIVLASVWLGDLLIDRFYFSHWQLFYAGFYWQYGAYVLITFIGVILSKRIMLFNSTVTKTSPSRFCINSINLLATSVVAALVFFIISNFGVWLNWHLYPTTFSGLIACYIAAIPFLKQSIISNTFYSLLLFGGFALIQKKLPVLAYKSFSSNTNK